MVEKLLTVAREAADIASSIHKKYQIEGFTSGSKDAHHNTVTSADIDSEKAIIETIRKSFPDHNILAEEGTYEPTGSPYTWIIDPLDGTNNFLKSYPHYAVSIGVLQGREVVAGVVCNSATDDIFHAVKGGGAFLNGKPIQATDQKDFQNALLLTGFHYDRDEQMRNTLKAIEHFFRMGVIGFRRTGSAALDICYIAAGWGDGFWEFHLNPWDVAAGILIAGEAGAVMTDFSGNPVSMKNAGSVVLANKILHPALLQETASIYQP